MLIYLLSPAKTLDFETEVPFCEGTIPSFLDQSSMLVEKMRQLSVSDLQSMMKISEKLAELNVQRFASWSSDYNDDTIKKQTRSAVFAFRGGVYQGLDVDAWNQDDVRASQQNLRILSGLYGVLRPLDLILPYRLEMGTKLQTQRGNNLYQFWGDLLTSSLNEDFKGSSGGTSENRDAIVNLASKEYFSAIQPQLLSRQVITPVFKDWKNGKLKVISFYAKKARGRMAAWGIRHRVKTCDELKLFQEDGYQFDASLSDDKNWVFTRAEKK